LAADALLLADNVLSHPEEAAGYRAMVEGLAELIGTVVPSARAYTSPGGERLTTGNIQRR